MNNLITISWVVPRQHVHFAHVAGRLGYCLLAKCRRKKENQFNPYVQCDMFPWGPY
jgi:hypothetical protein